jgi:hypothetical protein
MALPGFLGLFSGQYPIRIITGIDMFTGMYFCYIDESGDCGAFNPAMSNKTGFPYFILAGLIIHADNWKFSLDVFKAFRRKLAAQ